jgi:putative redox protein
MTQKHAIVAQIKGNTFAAKSDSNHWVVMDVSPKAGGHGAGASPKELLLFAVGGCTSSDVIAILNKKRVPLRYYELHIKAQERDEHPRIFTEIHMEYVFYSDDIRESDVERAIELSTRKYCSVSAMLEDTVRLTHSYRIEPADNVPVTPDPEFQNT